MYPVPLRLLTGTLEKMPTYTPEMDASLVAEMDRQRAAEAAKVAVKPPVSTDKGSPAGGATTDKVGDGQASATVTSAESGADKGATPPGTPEAFDISFLPDDAEVRSGLKITNEKAYAALKSGYMAHSEATKRFTAAKALEREAAQYRAIADDPEIGPKVVQMIADKMAGKPAVPAAPPEPEPEIDVLDPVERRKEIARVVEEAKTKFMAELRAPATRQQSVNDAITAYAEANGVDQTVMLAAVAEAKPELLQIANGERRVEDVPTLLRYALKAVGAIKPAPVAPPAVNKVAPVNGAPGVETVATPVGRGGTAATHQIPFPKFFVNGEPPNRPLTEPEYEEIELWSWRKRLGPNVTLEELRLATR